MAAGLIIVAQGKLHTRFGRLMASSDWLMHSRSVGQPAVGGVPGRRQINWRLIARRIGKVAGRESVPRRLAALGSDGQGGTLLTFSHGDIDFAGVAQGQFTSGNFYIT
jgi:hypothetical protein